MKKPELLSPVRDRTSFIAAINAGADAVYFGIGKLNLRVNSKGIELEELPELVKTAHEKNVKVYVTLNTIVYDEELELVDKLLDDIKAAGVDAIICSDIAVIKKARQQDIAVHISTQANISNLEAVKFYAEMGAERVVLARELTLKQVEHIKTNSPVEIEAFVHGAMCISVSGRCFMSQHLFGASGNRGDCYQPCRREYLIKDVDEGKEMEIGCGYVLSPKDMCTLPILDKLVKAGIDCFKIEGRSRSPEYIKAVTGAYRKAIDAIVEKKFDNNLRQELMQQLKSVYNRGFSTGFYMGKPMAKDYAKADGSVATKRKIAVGRILNYYPKIKIAYASVESCPLSVGDTVQIHGPTTGVLEFTLEQLRDNDEIKHKTIKKGKVTFPCPEKVRTNDRLFKIVTADRS